MRHPQIWRHGASGRVGDRAAQLPGAQSFPCHAQWREMPVRDAGYPVRALVRLLMAGVAMEPRCAAILRSSRDVHGMTMPIIALPWELGGRVTVEAPGVLEDRGELFEQGGGLHTVFVLLCLGNGCYEDRAKDARSERKATAWAWIGPQTSPSLPHEWPSVSVDRCRIGKYS